MTREAVDPHGSARKAEDLSEDESGGLASVPLLRQPRLSVRRQTQGIASDDNSVRNDTPMTPRRESDKFREDLHRSPTADRVRAWNIHVESGLSLMHSTLELT